MNVPSRPQTVRTQYSTGNIVSDYMYDMHVHRYRAAHSQYMFARTQMIYAERDMAIERENIRLLVVPDQLYSRSNNVGPIQSPRYANTVNNLNSNYTNTSNVHTSNIDTNAPASILNWRDLNGDIGNNTSDTYRRRGWSVFDESPLRTNIENNIDTNSNTHIGNPPMNMNSRINPPNTHINTSINPPITLPNSGLSRTLEFSIPLSLFNNIPTPSERITVDRATIDRTTRSTVYSQLENPINDTCGIALTRFQPDDFVRQIIHCGHIFMNRELLRWFERSSICPTCRHDLRTDIQIDDNTNVGTENSINRNALNIIDIASELNDINTEAEETDEEVERTANSMVELVESIIDRVRTRPTTSNFQFDYGGHNIDINEINAIDDNESNLIDDDSDNDDDSVEDIDT